MLRSFATGYAQARRDCLQHLGAGRLAAAHALARRCHTLAPTLESHRLLTITALRVGDWSTAATLGRTAGDT